MMMHELIILCAFCLVTCVGNTALHYAANRGQIDVAERLYALGAAHTIRNHAGRTAFECTTFDRLPVHGGRPVPRPSTNPAAANNRLSHRLTPPLMTVNQRASEQDEANIPSVFATQYGLEMVMCKYWDQTPRSACKQLLFQAQLLDAVEAGDDGDEVEVGRLVQWYLEQEREGFDIRALVYRHGQLAPDCA